MDEVDLMSIGSYTELPGGNIALPQGYSSVLAPIIQNIPPDNILKQHPVKVVNWQLREHTEAEESDDGSDCSVRTVKSVVPGQPPVDTGQIKGLCQFSLPASVVSSRRGSGDFDPTQRRSGQPNVRVETEDGKVFHADQLIATFPLGLLQKNPQYFDPPLPRGKQESMKKLVFGVVDKIYLSYEAPFLNPEISEIITLWNRVDEKTVPMEERWFRKIYSFCKGNSQCCAQCHNVLYFSIRDSSHCLDMWRGGKVHGEIEDERGGGRLHNDPQEVPCRSVHPQTKKLPFVRTSVKFVTYKLMYNVVSTSWSSQPYTGGSYTAIGKGGSQADIEKMAEPLTVRVNKTNKVSLEGNIPTFAFKIST